MCGHGRVGLYGCWGLGAGAETVVWMNVVGDDNVGRRLGRVRETRGGERILTVSRGWARDFGGYSDGVNE